MSKNLADLMFFFFSKNKLRILVEFFFGMVSELMNICNWNHFRRDGTPDF